MIVVRFAIKELRSLFPGIIDGGQLLGVGQFAAQATEDEPAFVGDVDAAAKNALK